jgi:hypothetical protein
VNLVTASALVSLIFADESRVVALQWLCPLRRMLDLSRVKPLEIFSALGFHPCPHHPMTRQQMLKKNEQDEQASACFDINYCIIMI